MVVLGDRKHVFAYNACVDTVWPQNMPYEPWNLLTDGAMRARGVWGQQSWVKQVGCPQGLTPKSSYNPQQKLLDLISVLFQF